MKRQTACKISYEIGLMVYEIQRRFPVELELPHQGPTTITGKIQDMYAEISKHAEQARTILFEEVED